MIEGKKIYGLLGHIQLGLTLLYQTRALKSQFIQMRSSFELELKSKRNTMILKPNLTYFFKKNLFECILHFQTIDEALDRRKGIVALLRCCASIFRIYIYVNKMG